VPTYAYTCTACKHDFEIVQSFSDDSLTECPKCEGRLRKVFNAVGVVFKGSGFYSNDSRSDSRHGSRSDSRHGSHSGSHSGSGNDSASSSDSGASSSDSSSSKSSDSSASTSSDSSSSTVTTKTATKKTPAAEGSAA
jgi:putative FmdB family regulatory protein